MKAFDIIKLTSELKGSDNVRYRTKVLVCMSLCRRCCQKHIVNVSLSCTVSEIINVKRWRALEIWVIQGR